MTLRHPRRGRCRCPPTTVRSLQRFRGAAPTRTSRLHGLLVLRAARPPGARLLTRGHPRRPVRRKMEGSHPAARLRVSDRKAREPSPVTSQMSAATPTSKTKWQLMLPTGRPKSSLHIVYLWYDAGRVRTCHSGYEPGDGHACLCRRNTLRFRTRSARRYTICCEKCGRTPPISWHL